MPASRRENISSAQIHQSTAGSLEAGTHLMNRDWIGIAQNMAVTQTHMGVWWETRGGERRGGEEKRREVRKEGEKRSGEERRGEEPRGNERNGAERNREERRGGEEQSGESLTCGVNAAQNPFSNKREAAILYGLIWSHLCVKRVSCVLPLLSRQLK